MHISKKIKQPRKAAMTHRYFLSSLGVLSAVLSAWVADGQVVDLHSENFEEKLNSGGSWFVMFHVNWCGICKRTFPMFEEASQKVIGTDIRAVSQALLEARFNNPDRLHS